jgi:hypothetical protein
VRPLQGNPSEISLQYCSNELPRRSFTSKDATRDDFATHAFTLDHLQSHGRDWAAGAVAIQPQVQVLAHLEKVHAACSGASLIAQVQLQGGLVIMWRTMRETGRVPEEAIAQCALGADADRAEGYARAR